ncbi:MAG: hypothetical protein ACFB2Y_09760 [Fulvivirga sp.]
MDKKVTGNSLKKKGTDLFVILLALAAGSITADQVQRLHRLIGPIAGALITAILAIKSKNARLSLALSVVSATHVGKAIKEATAGRTGFLSTVNSFTPTASLNGAGRLGNFQALPESSSGATYIEESLTGLGTMDEALALQLGN